MQIFEITYLSLMFFFLGMEVQQSKVEIFIRQKKYAQEILKMFQMVKCKEISKNHKEKF